MKTKILYKLIQMSLIFILGLYCYRGDAAGTTGFLCQQSQKAPQKIESFPHISEDFFVQFPTCREQPICITPERLSYLGQIGAIPSGSQTIRFLTGPFKEKASKPCQDPPNLPKSLNSLGEVMSKDFASYPRETSQLFNFVKKVKENSIENLTVGQKIQESILTCLHVKKDLLERKSPKQTLAEAYKAAQTKGEINVQNCEPLFDESIVYSELSKALTELRMSSFLLKLHKKHNIKSEFELVDLLKKWENSPRAFDDDPRTQGPIEKIEFDFLGTSMNSYFDGQPKKLAPLKRHELLGLRRHLEKLRQNSSIEQQDFISLAFQNTVDMQSQYPVLGYLKNSGIQDDELISALQHRLMNLNLDRLKGGDDFDFLNNTAVANSELSELSPQERGDLCVVLSHTLHLRKRDRQTPIVLLSGVGLGDKLYGVWIAKGLLKKSSELILGRSLPLAATGAIGVATSFGELQRQKEVCRAIFESSGGECDINRLKELNSEQMINLAVAVVFGVPLK